MSDKQTVRDKLGPARILLVEDQEPLRKAIARLLTRAGHTVAEAANGIEALAIVDGGMVEVILTDIAMPGMDGLQLLRNVRQRDLDLPVVLLTGAPTIESAAEAVAYGALKYLVKPVDRALLDSVARRAGALYRIAKAKRAAFELLGNQGDGPGDRAGLEASFERAVSGLWMAYQPIVSADAGALFGYEALMRSSEPTLPHPGAMLDAAERLGRLVELGRAVRAKALAPMDRAGSPACLFINLHPSDLADQALFDRASPLAAMASRIVLEITERASLHHVRDVRGRVARLRELGFRIAIDDLGAGYAGLTSFADLEPEIVKLDMSLVRDVDSAATKQKLISAMTSLCHDLGMLVVAEGVETIAERDALVALGCDLFQGYLFARPGRAFPVWEWPIGGASNAPGPSPPT